EINKLTGSDYKLFNYYGAKDAENIIIAMGSSCDCIEETVDYLNANGSKVGMINVHLYRPFSIEHFMKAIPDSVKKTAVLDRTKEPGSLGEPLYQDILTAYIESGRPMPKIVAGRYGLGSKDTTPAQIIAVYENLKKDDPKNHFTVGIIDDVTNLSLPVSGYVDVTSQKIKSCKFWGIGSDGTVSANKNSIKIIGDHTDMHAQAYFAYDSKKSGGNTQSHLRFGTVPIKATYLVKSADFIACHNESYVDKYDMVSDLKEGGTFLLNCLWSDDELNEKLPNSMKRLLAQKKAKMFIINATDLAKEIGLKPINTILQAAFFKLTDIIPYDDAVNYMKKAIVDSYGRKGEKVVNMNYAAVDAGITRLREFIIPADWAALADEKPHKVSADCPSKKVLVDFVNNVAVPVNAQKGESLPVSAFKGREDGTFPQGTAAFEKRGIAVDVPHWKPENCIQCNRCSYVCPHAAIRPFLLTDEEKAKAPACYETLKGMKGYDQYQYRMQVSPYDCYGCGACVLDCPAKEKALVMEPFESQISESECWKFSIELKHKANPLKPDTVKGSQFEMPLLEFSGACAGCGETPYAKLITQLYGDRMYIANATGCSSIWGGSAPSTPFCLNERGQGPTWANSLFEDNAEYGYGFQLAVKQRRNKLKEIVIKLAEMESPAEWGLKAASEDWLANMNDGNGSKAASDALRIAIDKAIADCGSCGCEADAWYKHVKENDDMLVKKSVWIFGGDGWAYDIGFGGLDHVIAMGDDVNILIFDTEVYSNTGGQSSKASPTASVAKFAASGKKVRKKDLGLMAMSYGYVYVTQIAMGANQAQTLKAITEAEAYPGPSVIIAYAPCISHGIRAGMGAAQQQTKRAVDSGYWHLYRYNPLLADEGKNPFVLESKDPTASFGEFINSEVRYTSLKQTFPEVADELFAAAEEDAKKRLAAYKRMAAEV
ncbi:MAG: pyruvate:ferredoxin (flavodoxin) oxidoreductase, partial [Defluviitaleaceae bacterium]|nr:pyruvate:ferredoxin (flavodoxin) oxidoreductase [Defluviitaleaceae bacterium]